MCARDSNITVGYPYFFFILYRYISISRSSKKKKKRHKSSAKSCIQLHAKCLYKFFVKLSFSFGSSKNWKKMEWIPVFLLCVYVLSLNWNSVSESWEKFGRWNRIQVLICVGSKMKILCLCRCVYVFKC